MAQGTTHEPSNTGSEQDRRAALQAIADWTRIVTSLSAGSIMLSATFLQQFYQGEAFWLLVSSWELFGLSVFVGLIGMGQRISQLAESDFRVRGGTLENLGLIQSGAFLAAVITFFLFALQNISQISHPCSP